MNIRTECDWTGSMRCWIGLDWTGSGKNVPVSNCGRRNASNATVAILFWTRYRRMITQVPQGHRKRKRIIQWKWQTCDDTPLHLAMMPYSVFTRWHSDMTRCRDSIRRV